jgi:hypothetical protein
MNNKVPIWLWAISTIGIIVLISLNFEKRDKTISTKASIIYVDNQFDSIAKMQIKSYELLKKITLQ